jgi:hypothetical protein
MERILVSLREAGQTQIQPQKNQGGKTEYKDTE